MPFLILLFVAGACSRQERVSDLFRWRSITPGADSALVRIERAFIAHESDSIMMTHVHSLETEARKHPESRQLMARHFYWLGRVSNQMHRLPEAIAYLQRAAELTDSAKYPYDQARINYLRAVVSKKSQPHYYRELRQVEDYFARTGDEFMLASAKLDIGHILKEIGDDKRSLANYLYADSVFDALGIGPYHIKTSLNNAEIYHQMGQDEKSIGLLEELIAHPVAKADFDFYNTLLLSKYDIASDTAALMSARRRMDSVPGYSYGRRNLEYFLTQYYADHNQPDSAISYARGALLLASDEMSMKATLYKTIADANVSLGKLPDAIEAYASLEQVREAMLQNNVTAEISRMDSRTEIVKYEEEIRGKQKVERMWIMVVLLVATVVVLAVFMMLMRRAHTHKLQIANSQLSLEKERRQLVTSMLRIEEKDKVLQALLSELDGMEKEARLSAGAKRQLEQHVKMHLSGELEWERFREVHDRLDPHFAKTLRKNFPDITEGELMLSTYIRLGMQTKQIARMLMLQPDSIKKNRQRLRRRLKLTPDQTLEAFLAGI